MRTKPNFNKAKTTAYKALQQHKITDFPINLLPILKSYDDINIISYSDMAKKRNCTLEEIIEANSSEDGSIHYCPIRNKYLIAYNDSVGHEQRVYWTLAHEFGHYLLGHHKESDRSSLARNEMSEQEYDTFEGEAHFFARFFLSPPPLIVQTKMSHYQKVMDFFGISYTAANKTLEYIEESCKRGFQFRLPPYISNMFDSFLNKVTNGKTCNNCNSFFYFNEATHCPICRSSDLHTFFIGDDINMKYEGYQLNENGYPVTRPLQYMRNIYN
ncbi:ImmA/IrrE family metallo-endopeptidase [Bacillus atrophaeus]|uniref:ImmA/IrrE family metallo-endopeptidase n=1 Tax=Bacillus atrophaeus TaxID=1452 RepID=UPI00227F671C|nr:ImmA/IrrE family metallo-endopeptidase [Bacillus atrophaeus]MCY8913166.1 ImmA/IrrE family metallo-endopeptidase [Bacillus atrophaeus]MCY9114686.1 ImmA/IrrE family metallo-endopeptidase [Bacillus atrophaeus]MEC0924182.1 ImmA/IrrE family metallo-endopeptidase [Bacillus atrophaeus]MEC0932793.1 ImmA/IrrE family metallo-endopeptidase [Bacillus atrophaeus]